MMITQDKYIDLLIEIARTQKELISQFVDMKAQIAYKMPTKPSGLFRKRSPQYEKRVSLLNKLQSLQSEASQYRDSKTGYHWWEIPWSVVEQYLVDDLTEIHESGNWRFEYSFEEIKDGEKTYVFLHEDGHCSLFDSDTEWDEYDASPLSSSDRQQIMKEYDSQVRRKEAEFVMQNEDSLIYSKLTDRYFSAEGYVNSSDHYLWKDHYRNKLEDSMKDIHESNTTYAVSRSVNYQSVYLAACYILDGANELYGVQYYPYTLNLSRGHLPQSFVDARQKRDSSVSVAAYFALNPIIRRVPISFFGQIFTDRIADKSMILRYAEVITCLADKIYKD